jgi:translation elongation factor EF-4
MGVEELLDRIVEQIPAPVGDADAPARAMGLDTPISMSSCVARVDIIWMRSRGSSLPSTMRT